MQPPDKVDVFASSHRLVKDDPVASNSPQRRPSGNERSSRNVRHRRPGHYACGHATEVERAARGRVPCTPRWGPRWLAGRRPDAPPATADDSRSDGSDKRIGEMAGELLDPPSGRDA